MKKISISWSIPIATWLTIAGATGTDPLQAQELTPPSEQIAQTVDSTGLKLRTEFMSAKKTTEKKKALIAYGDWILQNQNREEARYLMALLSYKENYQKMEWEAGGYLAGMIGLGIVPVDTAVAVWGMIGCPMDTAFSFVKRKVGEEAQIDAIYNFALYRKIDPLKAVGRMAGTKTPYGLSRAVELVGIGYSQVGEAEAVADALSVYGNMGSVMNEIIKNESLWRNLSYMVGLLDAVIKKSNQNEKPANMEKLGNVVYEKVKAGGPRDLARWFVISQFSNSSGAADQYASACFLLFGAGFYASADTTVGLAKNCDSNPENVLQNYFRAYSDGKVSIERYLELVQKCGEFTYCIPEKSVEWMCKTQHPKALEKAINFIETYQALAGDPENLSKSLYLNFSRLSVFRMFIKSKIENKTSVYVPFYSNAIYCAGMDEINQITKEVAKEIDGDYELAEKVYTDLLKKDKLRADGFASEMVGNALKDFDKVWSDWVKNPNSKTEVALDRVLMFLVKNYGRNQDATDKLNSILKSDKYTDAQKYKIRRQIEIEAKTSREAKAALQLLDSQIKSSQTQQAESEKMDKINRYPSYILKLNPNITFPQLDAMDNDTLRRDVKSAIKDMAGSITTFDQDIQKILNGKKGMERKILIWTIVEAVCEINSSAAVLKAMNLVKDPVLSRQEAEEVLGYITRWDSSKNYGGLRVQINEMAKWIQENKKNGK
ncbi:MAG: hypothetical protein QXL47_04215 [Candidatus Anstonellales archaeon]